MDDHAPGAGGAPSALEVERRTLARVRGWLTEVSEQFERDRQESRRRLFRYLLLMITAGIITAGLTAMLVRRSFDSVQERLQNKSDELDKQLAVLNAGLDAQTLRFSALNSDVKELRDTIKTLKVESSNLSSSLRKLSESTGDDVRRLSAELRSVETRHKALLDTVREINSKVSKPTANPPARNEKSQPAPKLEAR